MSVPAAFHEVEIDFAPLLEKRKEVTLVALETLRNRFDEMDVPELIASLAILLGEEGE